MRRRLIALVVAIGCLLLFAAVHFSIDAAIGGTQYAQAMMREFIQNMRSMGPIILPIVSVELMVLVVIKRYWHRYN